MNHGQALATSSKYAGDSQPATANPLPGAIDRMSVALTGFEPHERPRLAMGKPYTPDRIKGTIYLWALTAQ